MASDHSLDWLRGQTDHWVGKRRDKLNALLDDIEASTVNAWYSARLLQMIYDDLDTCAGERGGDYEFKELSTETVEAMKAFRAIGAPRRSDFLSTLRELHRVCLESDAERPDSHGISPGEYDAAMKAAEAVLSHANPESLASREGPSITRRNSCRICGHYVSSALAVFSDESPCQCRELMRRQS